MISKYSIDGKLREYKVSLVKQGTSKNGKPYTICSIADVKKQEDGTNLYNNYKVFSWQENLTLNNDDKITFEEITSIDFSENEYNGKKYLNKTIYANIKVIPNEEQTPKEPEIIGEIEPLDSDDLPF